jgi:hypothetical protein
MKLIKYALVLMFLGLSITRKIIIPENKKIKRDHFTIENSKNWIKIEKGNMVKMPIIYCKIWIKVVNDDHTYYDYSSNSKYVIKNYRWRRES